MSLEDRPCSSVVEISPAFLMARVRLPCKFDPDVTKMCSCAISFDRCYIAMLDSADTAPLAEKNLECPFSVTRQ